MKLITALISNLITVFSFGQTGCGKVHGIVIDAFTKTPLSEANITLRKIENQERISTITNKFGEFIIDNIPVGRCSFIVEYLGYKAASISDIMISSGKDAYIEFNLEENINKIGEIVVTARVDKVKPLNEMALVSARTFSVEETERFAGSIGDPARMVSNYAGVTSANDSRNDIVIRGNSPTGVLWRLEGIDIVNPNHFAAQGTTGGPVSMLNSNLISNSDFFTGAFSAEYGNALSGIFDINLRSGNKEHSEFVGK